MGGLLQKLWADNFNCHAEQVRLIYVNVNLEKSVQGPRFCGRGLYGHRFAHSQFETEILKRCKISNI